MANIEELTKQVQENAALIAQLQSEVEKNAPDTSWQTKNHFMRNDYQGQVRFSVVIPGQILEVGTEFEALPVHTKSGGVRQVHCVVTGVNTERNRSYARQIAAPVPVTA